jgi:hypothetical protein
VFNFTPPHTDLAWIASLAGTGCIVIPSMRRRRRGRDRRAARTAVRNGSYLGSDHGS